MPTLNDERRAPRRGAREDAPRPPVLNRRSVLLRGALGAGMLAGGGFFCNACSDEPAISAESSKALARRLLGCGAAPEEVRPLGRAYVETAPEEADALSLVRALCRGWSDAEMSADGDALCTRLRAQSREDFAVGRHVVLEGWVVSRTEARLAALAGTA